LQPTALDGRGLSAPRPGHFTLGNDPVPTVLDAGWAPRPVLKGEENLAITGIRSAERPGGSKSLYILFAKCVCGFRVQRIAIGCSKTPVVGKREQEVVAIVCLLVKSRLVVVMFSRHVCTLQADKWLVCAQSVSFRLSSGLEHEMWERRQSDLAQRLQLSPGTNINQLTNRGNSIASIRLAPCTVQNYWCICPVRASSEQYYKYSLGSLYSAQLLVYLSSTLVVGTVRQVYAWLLVQFTVTGVFVQYTSRGNSTTSIHLAPCTVNSNWCICPVHQSWEQ
jgi:hypothetical protein